MNQKFNFKHFIKNFYNWYLALLTILVSLPILAPVFLKLGLNLPAKIIYFVYSFFCHQFSSRSIHLFDYQYAWCSRDTGIWIGVAIVAWLMRLNKLKAIKWYWAIPFIIPIALDGGLQTIFTVLSIQPMGLVTGAPVYISNNLLRFMTGALFGIGISLWISGSLISSYKEQEEKEEYLNGKAPSQDKFQDKKLDSNFKIFNRTINKEFFKVVIVYSGSIIVYLFMVQLWNLTGINNKAGNFSDSIVKTPQEDFFQRRGDAICPTKDINNLFNIDCFIK